MLTYLPPTELIVPQSVQLTEVLVTLLNVALFILRACADLSYQTTTAVPFVGSAPTATYGLAPLSAIFVTYLYALPLLPTYEESRESLKFPFFLQILLSSFEE